MEVVYRVEYPNLPLNLKEKRQIRGWSQQELAMAAGLSIGVVRKVEQGVQSIELETIARLCDALGAKLEPILGDSSTAALVPHRSLIQQPSLPQTPQIGQSPNEPAIGTRDVWQPIIEIYNQHKPKLWATCRGLSEKRQRSLRSLLKQFGSEGLLERLASALKWATADEWWSSKTLDFDTLLRENRLISWSERWESCLSHLDETTQLNFGQWFDRAKAQGLVIASLRQKEEQLVILPDGTQRPYEEMRKAHPLVSG